MSQTYVGTDAAIVKRKGLALASMALLLKIKSMRELKKPITLLSTLSSTTKSVLVELCMAQREWSLAKQRTG